MLLNYLKLSLRLLARNPFFTTINVVGLAIGFASFYALWEYSTTELKADQYHKDSDRIARIATNWNWSDDRGKTWGHLAIGAVVSSMVPAISHDYPEVEGTLRLLNQRFFTPQLVNHDNKIVITVDDQKTQPRVFKEENVAYADQNLFSFFSIPLLYGEADKVLNEVNSVVIARSTAEKYFGSRNPAGELLKMNDSTTLKVTGVFEDLPHYSHLVFELVISSVGLQDRWNGSTGGWNGWTACYVKFNRAEFKSFEDKLNARTNEFWAEAFRIFPNAKLDVFIQPLKEIPFSNNFIMDNFYARSKPLLFTLAFIAISVLVMAWVNYVNLSVTRTTRRFKEIATRKVSGAGTGDMILQFVTESWITNLLAIALAFTIIQVIRRPFSNLFNIQIDAFSSLSIRSTAIFLSIITGGILLSGLYPAIISMAHQPRALFQLKSTSRSRRFIPSLLTISQLAVAVIFILLGFTVSHQLSYILNMSTGIEKNDVVVVDGPVIKPANYLQSIGPFKNQISSLPQVSAVTCSKTDITDFYDFENPVVKRLGTDLSFGMDGNTVDEDFVKLYGIRVIAGRNFVKDDRPDAILLSRFAVTRMGFDSPENAVGSRIHINLQPQNWKEAEVVGVFENFRITSFLNMTQSSTEATDEGRGFVLMNSHHLFADAASDPEKISIKVSSADFDEAIRSIHALFDRQFPGNAFTWYFLNEQSNQVYVHEKTARNQIVLFTALALLIACLGMLGMISNRAAEKTKEIGIRKVLGAKLSQIAQLLLNTTLKQVIIATCIGIPVAYYLTNQYLDKFSVRIELQWWHFALPVLILSVIMFLTIASVLWKAARSNPVEALRTE